MPDVTRRLVDRCVSAPDRDLPQAVRDAHKQHLLDTLGVTVGAAANAGSTPAFEAGFDALAGGGPGDATALPSGRSLTAEHAALRNGVLAHSLDFDDTHRESSLHPGAPVVPGALAVAEREGTSTERFLRALDAGYDVACTLGMAVNPDVHYARGFHITATCGTFGATAAAGVVQGLDAEGFADAFGINGSQAAGSLQFLENGAWNKRLHPGLAARRAVTATALAAAGVRGASRPIEGENGFFVGYTSDPLWSAFDGLESRHAVLETGLKPYPCCRYMHPALDGLVDLAGTADPDAVESIRVELPTSGVKLTGDPIDAKRRPDNFVDCQFSMPFGAAVALTAGAADLDAFLEAQPRLDDPALRRLMDATEVVTTDEVQSLFPARWAARVVVGADGDTHERFVDVARGEPEAPLSWDEVAAKFEALATSAGLSPRGADRVVEIVRDLEAHDVGDLVEALTRPAVTATDD